MMAINCTNYEIRLGLENNDRKNLKLLLICIDFILNQI